MFVLFTRWGRVGETGQFQRTPFNTKEEAVNEFCKIFKQKSGNAWADVKRFVYFRFFIYLSIYVLFNAVFQKVNVGSKS